MKRPQRESRVHEKYLRHSKKFPNVWCAGCGIGIVMGAIVRAVDGLQLDKNDVAMISGIGCTGRMPVYVDFNTMHTTHGRALAFATGLKMVRPEMKVIVVMGDGDALAIGGNHFIHAARRNIGLTAIVVNNFTYGMTGGQYSPTTPIGALAATAPYGHIEQPFPIAELAVAAGAAFVARSTVYHVQELEKYIAQAITKEGFAVVEAVSYCHTTLGRINHWGTAPDMMRRLKEQIIPLKRAKEMSEEEKRDVIVRGVFVNRDIPEYTRLYDQIIERAQEWPPPPYEERGGGDLMARQYGVRLAGTGGQGAILAGILLAEAAIRDGKNVTQIQSYGPEARGGASRSEVMISDGEIYYPKVIQADITLCMSQEACDRYGNQIRREGLLILDADHVTRAPTTRAVRVPMTTLARDVTGQEIVANVVGLGLLAGLTGVVSRESLEAAVRDRAPRGTADVNLKALAAGFEAAGRVREGEAHD